MMLRPVGDQVTVRSVPFLLGAYMGGLAIILAVTVVQSLLLAGEESSSFDPLVGALAMVGALAAAGIGYFGALAAAGIGYFGAQGVRSVVGEGQQVGEPTEIAAIRSRTLVRVAPLAAVGIGTAVLVMMQLFSTA